MTSAPAPPPLRSLSRSLPRSLRWRHHPLPRPRLPRPGRPSAAWLGPILIGATVASAWPAFAGAVAEEGGGGIVDPAAFGLFIGMASIILMAWSFVLAVRIRVLEPLFGGLDRVYRVHRWIGSLAVAAMFLHVRIEPEIDNGIRGASRGIADTAEGLAGIGEYLLYGLVAASAIRMIPHHWWKWSHKLLGIPFLFASWHAITAEKTYANGSAWGWWFGSIIGAGAVAWLWRVVGRDLVRKGRPLRITSLEATGDAVELRARGAVPEFSPGQFAFVRIDAPGFAEEHPFSIASAPEDDEFRLVIRDLGDWSGRLVEAAAGGDHSLVGTRLLVEGPYGAFDPLDGDGPCVWVAGGVGVTPFLSAARSLAHRPADGRRPATLLYACRHRSDLGVLPELTELHDRGVIDLHVHVSSEGDRVSPTDLQAVLAAQPGAVDDVTVALCGPTRLVHDMADAARDAGVRRIHHEDFDIRAAVGPELVVG